MLRRLPLYSQVLLTLIVVRPDPRLPLPRLAVASAQYKPLEFMFSRSSSSLRSLTPTQAWSLQLPWLSRVLSLMMKRARPCRAPLGSDYAAALQLLHAILLPR